MWTDADLVILVPMLGRAHTIAPLLDSIDAATPDAAVCFITTAGDTAVNATVAATGRHHLRMRRRRVGDYAAKINAAITVTDQPLIFTGACDLRFHPGWFDRATRHLSDRIHVVGTNDLGNRRVTTGQHSTHSLVTRAYAERGTIDGAPGLLHEGYVHEYVDDEFVGTAKHRGAFAMALDAHVEHVHPDYGKAPSDAMYRAQRGRMKQSVALYRQRRHLWT